MDKNVVFLRGGFGGEGISGGEAQSISSVRAILRKFRMILADEVENSF